MSINVQDSLLANPSRARGYAREKSHFARSKQASVFRDALQGILPTVPQRALARDLLIIVRERRECTRRRRNRSGSPKPRRGRSESPKKKGSERKTVFKRLKKVYFTGSEIKRRLCLYTQATQGVGRTAVATGTLKAATKVPDQEQRTSPRKRHYNKRGLPTENG
ncbi:hypothetical protein Tco_1193241 [Tanacetum coccineum]